MEKPTVSIIIPTFNRAKLLKRALESVLNQDYENIIEIIVTDDGSTDETEKIVEEFQKKDQRIIFVKNTKYPKGPTGNKNNGLDFAKGDFIGILDDDDVLLPDAISKLINVYLEKGYKMIFGNCLMSDNNQFSGKTYGKSEEVNYKDIICGKYEGEYWGIFHKDLLREKRFSTDTFGGEVILWWQMYKISPGYYLNEPVRIYNVENPEAVSRKYLKFPQKSFLNYKYTLDFYGEDLKKFCPKRFIKVCILAAFFARIAGDYKNFLKYTKLAFQTKENFLFKTLFLLIFSLPLPKFFFISLYFFGKKLLRLKSKTCFVA
ncbi:MAG: glycosyltransferase family 2 protein [Minisyncoccia bacterium]